MAETQEIISAGVKELIDKLRKDGVESGQSKADEIVSAAEKRAVDIVEKAKKQADKIISEAKKESLFIQQSAHEAIEIAANNAICSLKENLLNNFSKKIQQSIELEMEDQGLLSKMILEVARQHNLSEVKDIEVVLPEKYVLIEDLRKKPEELKQGSLAYFVALNAKKMFSDGVSFKVDKQLDKGVKFILKNNNIDLVLDDEAVALMLLNHLKPRFRALLEGLIT